MFVYKLSVCGFKSCFSHLIFRSCAGLSKELLDIQATSRMQIYSTCTCNMLKAHSQCKYPDPPKTWMKNTKKLEKTKPRKKVWYVSLREEWVCMPGWDRCAITLANPHTHHIKNTPMVCHFCKTLVWFPKFSWFIHFLHSKLHFLRFSLFICLSNCIKLFIYFSYFL